MSKLYLWGTVVLFVVLGFWRYSVVVQELGEAEQANRQYQATIKSMQSDNDRERIKRKHDSETSFDHHNEALAIMRKEMKSNESLFLYKISKLKKEVEQIKNENKELKLGFKTVDVKTTLKEASNENNAEECAELPIPDFYLKQL